MAEKACHAFASTTQVGLTQALGVLNLKGGGMFKAANTTVMVKDMDNAIAFYTDVLGLPTGMRDGNNYAEIKAPGVIIGLHPDRGHVHKKLKAGNLSIGFEVANIEVARFV